MQGISLAADEDKAIIIKKIDLFITVGTIKIIELKSTHACYVMYINSL